MLKPEESTWTEMMQPFIQIYMLSVRKSTMPVPSADRIHYQAPGIVLHSHAVSAFRILSVRAESVGTTGASRFNKTSLLVSIMSDHKVTPEPGGETTKFHKK